MKLMKFKRAAVTVLIVLAAYLLQCTLFNHLELAGIKPNLILIVTASFGFMRGQKEGMLVGFFAGLITDIQFGTILGFYALLYLVIGFVNGLFEQLYFDEDIKLPLFLIPPEQPTKVNRVSPASRAAMNFFIVLHFLS